jgi:hypothetical protein
MAVMKTNDVALVGRADPVRVQLASYLRDSGFDVFECDEVALPQRFAGVVVMDDGDSRSPNVHKRVQAWIHARTPLRVVIVSSRPAGWRAIALAHPQRLWVLAAPAFGWQIVDALRATTLDEPQGA